MGAFGAKNRVQAIVFAVVVGILVFALVAQAQRGNGEPVWDLVPEHSDGMDHSAMFADPIDDVHAITEKCLMCHNDVADHFMKTSHWTWVNDEIVLPGGTEPVPFGKINSINNYCVAVPSNWGRCTQCHAGYGWKDASFDFSDKLNIDCLICHDTTGTYKKAKTTAGYPEEDVDLLLVAQNVGMPTRATCGACHFVGGGGNAVKHGDLDNTMIDCPDETDVHMGVNDFVCQDCHWTDNHDISGRLPWLTTDESKGFACNICHGEAPHEADQLNDHSDSLACQTCHIPTYAPETPTKVDWDWSFAGLDEAPDERKWDKKKGSFQFVTDAIPEFYWWNGKMENYLPGEDMDPAVRTDLNAMLGDINDPDARIWPVKVHRGKQPYDTNLNHFLVPKLFGSDAFWKTWDWNSSLALGAEASGVEFSGEFGFAETAMYWPLNHMVRTADRALGCMDCHGDEGRMPWEDLGYEGDPISTGGR